MEVDQNFDSGIPFTKDDEDEEKANTFSSDTKNDRGVKSTSDNKENANLKAPGFKDRMEKNSNNVPNGNKKSKRTNKDLGPRRRHLALNGEGKTLENSLHFFKDNDEKQKRYDSEEDYFKGIMPFAGSSTVEGRGHDMKPSEKYSEMNRGKADPHTSEVKANRSRHGAFLYNDVDGNTFSKAKRTIQKFGRKIKPREKDAKISSKQKVEDSIAAKEYDPSLIRTQNLIGLVLLGLPSINLFASCLLADESGITRSPLLLTLLGFRLTDISPSHLTRNRRFRIDLEYGVWEKKMIWSVERSAKDLLYLHSRFKLDNWKSDVLGTKSSRLPKYPIPNLRINNAEYHKLKSKNMSKSRRQSSNTLEVAFDNAYQLDPLPKDEDSRREANAENLNAKTLEELLAESHHINQGEQRKTASSLSVNRLSTVASMHTNNESNSLRSNNSTTSGHSFRDHLSNIRKHLSSAASITSSIPSPEQIKFRTQQNERYLNEVEKYLAALIKFVALKPQSNRLFQFFELSPISSLLSYENNYIGKQGSIHISTGAKSQGWRVGHFKANDIKEMIDRRSEKWCLVRGSYVMYVSNINSTVPLEVFLVDSKFTIKVNFERNQFDNLNDDESDYEVNSIVQKALDTKENIKSSSATRVFRHLRITLENSERKITLIPKSRREQKLWYKSLNEMRLSTIWSESQRFDSFAPVRENCFAQWFVDGRDYFWALSSALEMAKDVIFIHDWWLSPELYLRRPANGNQQWRIDRILQRKAQQGVKIFVIVYRNVGTTVVTDSLYTKHSLLSLHDDNIHVLRSPNQLLQNTYFWAHHEKLCIIDSSVAFLGGIDLCYGRYDTPQHVLVDDSSIDFQQLSPSFKPDDVANFQTFPGKDYSNPRVKDFSSLDKPYESMYDRNSVPRMPWHDVHMLLSGKAVRDLGRHFVQRWNYLLRQKRPSRYTPLLTPPPDLSDEELMSSKLDGSCQVQLLRSAGSWSLGLKETEHSVQNAYLKLIETSEHFVYIENQFFITSCVVDNNVISNRIGDALVDRIIRAFKEGKQWKAIIIIPLMPGFEAQVDEPDGSSVRVIMQCQYMSISRHSTSIYAKLRKYGIEPSDYIQFFSLRKWGRIGPDRNLVTEQLYIHAKTMIVDDKVAIIGSANINERSLKGSRDSEVAAVVVDKKMVKTKMNGVSYMAGNFAHSLRKRLMREHLGVAIDLLDVVERRFKKFEEFAATSTGMLAVTNVFKKKEDAILSAMVEIASRHVLQCEDGTDRWKNFQNEISRGDLIGKLVTPDFTDEEDNDAPEPAPLPISFNNRTGQLEANKGIRDKKKISFDPRVQNNDEHKKDVLGIGQDKYKTKAAKWARLNSNKFLKDLAKKTMSDNLSTFLPNMESVLEFLNANDHEHSRAMTAESENLLVERNQERWIFLKKICYLQHVAAKHKLEEEEELKKRLSSGIDPPFIEKISGIPKSSVPQTDIKTHSSGFNGDTLVSSNLGSSPAPVGTSDNIPISHTPSSDLRPLEGVGLEDVAGNVPVMKLDEFSAKQIIDSVVSEGAYNFTKFMDPYVFDDPLAIDFYEDLWYETARRNTEFYRLVFHSQPDDTVLTWNDYKRFMKLNKAFKLSQQKEANKRRQNALFRSRTMMNEYGVSESDIEDSGPQESNSSDSTSIDNKDGLLGRAPPTKEDGRSIEENFKKEPFYSSSSENRSKDDENFMDASESIQSSTINIDQANKEHDTSEDNYCVKDSSGEKSSKIAHIKSTRTRRVNQYTARKIRNNMGDKVFERNCAETILKEIQGNLVLFPTEWLSTELEAGNWFYSTDRIPPIDIYD